MENEVDPMKAKRDVAQVMRKFCLFSLIFFSCLPFVGSAEDSPASSSDFGEMNFDFSMEEESVDVAPARPDPFVWWNRPVSKMNRWLLSRLMAPVVSVVEKVPSGMRQGVTNVSQNLSMPLQAVNLLLQGKFKDSGRSVMRFALNSTVGCLGMADVADSEFGLKAYKEDFGQTFGFHGVPSGPYVEMPFFGPTTVRDLLARPLDWPFQGDRYLFPHNPELRWAWSMSEFGVGLPFLHHQVKSVEKDAIDPYTFVRDAFLQMREAQVKR